MNNVRGKKLSIQEARNFLISYQGLNNICNYKKEEGIVEYFTKVGCIQYDPLNVVGRNADLILQSRIEGYNTEMLNNLLYEKRILIDGWDKMMSIYLQTDWPYFKRLRKSKGEEMKWILARRNSIDALNHLDKVKQIIVEEGPKQGGQIDIGKCNPGKWGHKQISSSVLDYLFNIGELGIYSKNNVQRTYDLVENLFSKEIVEREDPFESDDEFYEWYVKRRIGSVGMLWAINGGGWLGHFLSDSTIRIPVIERLLECDEIKEFYVESIKKPFYIRTEDLDYFNQISTTLEVRFLAPLDNLLWDRKMIEKIFDFKYSWEVYTPVSKRKFGYYVLPVLYGSKFVGRFEPEQYRGEEELRIKNWWWEENVSITDELIFKLEIEFDRFCKYLGASCINQKDFKDVVLKQYR